MRLLKIIVGELVLILASVLIFRSVWTLLDQYLGVDYLAVLLIIGLILAVPALILLNREVNSNKAKKPPKLLLSLQT